jgi:TPR repeat protein
MTSKHYVLKLIIACSLMLSISACNLQPNWYEAGKWNYAHQHYDLALPQLLWAAQMGNPNAQYAVGYMYFNGLGTPQDDILAYHWFKKSAEAGNTRGRQALQAVQGETTENQLITTSRQAIQPNLAPTIPEPSDSSLKISAILPMPVASK